MARVEYYRSADGRLLARQNQTQFVLILAGLLLIVLLLLSGWGYRASHHAALDSKLQIMAAETFVRAELQPGDDERLFFAPQAETNIKELQLGEYIVRGWVDRISNDGEANRIDFSCTMRANTSGDWVKEELTLFPAS